MGVRDGSARLRLMGLQGIWQMIRARLFGELAEAPCKVLEGNKVRPKS